MGGQREIIVRSKIEIFELKSATGKVKTPRFSRRLEEAELVSLKTGQLKRSSLRSRKKRTKETRGLWGQMSWQTCSWSSRRGES